VCLIAVLILDSREQLNDFYDDVGIPCEWCFQSIPIENYQRHAVCL